MGVFAVSVYPSNWPCPLDINITWCKLLSSNKLPDPVRCHEERKSCMTLPISFTLRDRQTNQYQIWTNVDLFVRLKFWNRTHLFRRRSHRYLIFTKLSFVWHKAKWFDIPSLGLTSDGWYWVVCLVPGWGGAVPKAIPALFIVLRLKCNNMKNVEETKHFILKSHAWISIRAWLPTIKWPCVKFWLGEKSIK